MFLSLSSHNQTSKIQIMKRTLICKLKEKVGESVKIDVWIETIRKQGSISFLLVRDISGKIQIVVSKSSKQVFDVIEKITQESVRRKLKYCLYRVLSSQFKYWKRMKKKPQWKKDLIGVFWI